MAKKKPGRLQRSRPQQQRVIRLGRRLALHRDLYHWFLTLPLPAVAAVCACFYVVLNLFFALLYLIEPGSITNARPGSLADAFFFSVQTLATIGYGNMYPESEYANVLVTVETVTGLMYFALITGIVFTRFSRPSARVLFSSIAVVGLYDGVPTLMFRMANERRNQILHAEVQVTLLRAERSPEGVPMWRQHDLKLVRGQSSFFSLSWTIFHPIDEDSPLRGETTESLIAGDSEIVVLLAGVDEVLSQTVYARHAYEAADIKWGYRFADVLVADGTGGDERVIIDYTRFDEIEPAPLGDVPARKRAAERA
ncbi:MAG TPA: ion channel [Alphaproteobacteria bacterium]|nr:ion channel [Alphaproteobacteria bacterium]